MLHWHDVATDHKWLDWSKYIKHHLTTNPQFFPKFKALNIISRILHGIGLLLKTRDIYYTWHSPGKSAVSHQMPGICSISICSLPKPQRRSKQLRPRTSPKSMVRTERPKEFCMAKLEQASEAKRGEVWPVPTLGNLQALVNLWLILKCSFSKLNVQLISKGFP